MVRIPLEKIGFWPGNRGGNGVGSFHVHEVANDIMANKIRRIRYEPVELLEIPHDLLAQFKQVNREKCESDPLMPRFSSKMEYVCASKTHFTHALKLAKEATHTLFNQVGAPRITFKMNDSEADEIMTQGLVCAIYDKTIFGDLEAIDALSADANLNSNVDCGEDEMQAFGRVDILFNRIAADPKWIGHDIPVEHVLQKLNESCGFGQFVQEDWIHFIALRKALPANMANVLRQCQFDAAARRVRAKPIDFGAVAKLDPRAPWTKVALMFSQYIGNNGGRNGSQPSTKQITFRGRNEVFAQTFSSSAMLQLRTEPGLLNDFEAEIKALLNLYKRPPPTALGGCGTEGPDVVLRTARGEFLAKCGRMLLRVVAPLVTVERNAKLIRRSMKPEEREICLAKAKKGKLAQMENQFREILIIHKVFTDDSLPTQRNPVITDEEAHSKAKVKVEAHSPAKVVKTQCLLEGDDQNFALTANDVFGRLGISGLGEEVMALPDSESDDSLVDTKEELLSDGEEARSQVPQHGDREGKWCVAMLRSLDGLIAHVETTSTLEVKNDKGVLVTQQRTHTYRVHVDNLRPSTRPDARKLVLHPTLVDSGEEMDICDYRLIRPDFVKSMVDYVLAMGFQSVSQIVGQVKVSRLQAKDKFPLVFQCRAQQQYKVGQLVLAPGGGHVTVMVERKPGDDDDPLPEAHQKKKKSIIHEAMLSLVRGSTRTVLKDKRIKNKDDLPTSGESSFAIRSPLLDAKANKGADGFNLNPFWVVLRCVGPKSVPNMKLEFESVTIDHLDLAGMDKKGLETEIRLPILRNSTQIENGDVLCLQWLKTEDGDG